MLRSALAVIFVILLLIGSIAAMPPLNIRVNNAILKTDIDVYDFGINNIGIHDFGVGSEPTSFDTVTITLLFGKSTHTIVEDITFEPIGKPNPDPINAISPGFLLASGNYRTKIGGLLGNVTWVVTTEDSLKRNRSTIGVFPYAFGVAIDNDTKIIVQFNTMDVKDYIVGANASKKEQEFLPKEQEYIDSFLSLFNETLKHLELHYLNSTKKT